MAKQVIITDTKGRQMAVFVAAEGVTRDGRRTFLVTKVEGSPYLFSVYADLCGEA